MHKRIILYSFGMLLMLQYPIFGMKNNDSAKPITLLKVCHKIIEKVRSATFKRGLVESYIVAATSESDLSVPGEEQKKDALFTFIKDKKLYQVSAANITHLSGVFKQMIGKGKDLSFDFKCYKNNVILQDQVELIISFFQDGVDAEGQLCEISDEIQKKIVHPKNAALLYDFADTYQIFDLKKLIISNVKKRHITSFRFDQLSEPNESFLEHLCYRIKKVGSSLDCLFLSFLSNPELVSYLKKNSVNMVEKYEGFPIKLTSNDCEGWSKSLSQEEKRSDIIGFLRHDDNKNIKLFLYNPFYNSLVNKRRISEDDIVNNVSRSVALLHFLSGLVIELEDQQLAEDVILVLVAYLVDCKQEECSDLNVYSAKRIVMLLDAVLTAYKGIDLDALRYKPEHKEEMGEKSVKEWLRELTEKRKSTVNSFYKSELFQLAGNYDVLLDFLENCGKKK